MHDLRQMLQGLFAELNEKIGAINDQRKSLGQPLLSKAKVRLLGQISLMIHPRVSLMLSLAQTGDLDALLDMDHVVKSELQKALAKQGLVYDEDSYLIWIPPQSRFEPLFDSNLLIVESLDPESVLVSKAVKAPHKNKQLIRQAIASREFPSLVDRIISGGGKLEFFA